MYGTRSSSRYDTMLWSNVPSSWNASIMLKTMSRLPLLDRPPHHRQVVADAERVHVVLQLAQRHQDVVLGLPRHRHQVVAR